MLRETGPRIVFSRAKINGAEFKGDLKAMILKDNQQVSLAIQPVDAKGKPAQVDGKPAWESSDPSIVSVTPSDDGLSAVAAAGQNLGHAQISVKADADLGEGVRLITGVLEFDVVAGEAVSLSIIAGQPEDQPQPAS